jgi:predicted AAA+ superfamily ATPase
MLIRRQNQAIIEKSFTSSWITVLLGPRRVGKTTLVNEFGQKCEPNSWITLNFDDLALKTRIEGGGLEKYIEEKALRKVGSQPKIIVAIDEAQKCPAAFEQIKILYDRYKDKDVIKFILTGSAMLNLHQLSAESLAGRVQIYYLRGFNLRETAAYQANQVSELISPLDLIFSGKTDNLQATISELSPWQSRLLTALDWQLIWGNFPEILNLENDDERLNYLANYLQTYLEKDVREITSITDLALYRKMIDIIAQQTGSVKDDTRILNTLNCNRETLKKYRDFLEATLLYQEIYPFILSPLKRLVKSPKCYLLNNGLISYVTDIANINILETTGIVGARLENWLLTELQIALDRIPRNGRIYFWRTSSGAEVDFVVQFGTKVFPFEVTHNKHIERKKIRNLSTFLQAEKVDVGYYVYHGDYKFDPELRIHFLPIWTIG